MTNAEVYGEFDGVVETIRRRAMELAPPPRPSPADAGEGVDSALHKASANLTR